MHAPAKTERGAVASRVADMEQARRHRLQGRIIPANPDPVLSNTPLRSYMSVANKDHSVLMRS